MELSIIIPTCDRGAVFDRSLEEVLKAIQEVDAEVIVINDSKISRPLVPPSPRVSLLDNPRSGVASARNLGASKSQGAIILFVDDDIVISAESVRHILRVHRENPHIALNLDWMYPPELMQMLDKTTFGRFLSTHNMTTFKGWYADVTWKDQDLFESRSVASFHLSLSREDFMKTGGYDEQFPFAGFEDYDFPLRLKKAGIRFRIDTRIAVYHNEVDRMAVRKWLDSQERRAFTRAVAVQRGYRDLTIPYSVPKRWLLVVMGFGYPILLALLAVVPNSRSADRLAFAWIGYLQAIKIFRGYSLGMKK